MRTRIIQEKDVDAALNETLLESLRLSFPDGEVDFAQTRCWHGSAPTWSALLEEDGRILAHVGVHERTISVGEQQVRVAGIQNVFVLPDQRGRGLSDIVMNASMDEAGKLGLDYGLLFCLPVLEKVYARCGWRTIPDRTVLRIDEDGQECPLPTINIAMFYPLARKEFPEGIIHLQGNDW